ncbi:MULTISPECIES: ABC transporter ATP-binding protein [unclassified Granulicatella]|uniref:ABC transporter ATP-binding protein n=1 Tax=unclassified Granulicatella TaxID=2630493 RepID=UPI0010741E93|nr:MULTISPECIES: ABC transporter ATP-binding protein [unclassified Granulicatella]MBF0780640.1 ABC transporter ATP-binding protein [Granulicatella sp. 19428wC4_WM01]TFU94569.1 ABC transporter ATP-binding protein [Granulicatella sp. WM01]
MTVNELTLKIENLSYFYENGDGINGFNFELNKGDFLAVIGISGSGKTTLINTILGILKKKTGNISIGDHIDISKISFSPQNQAIDWYLNVFDNIYMGALFSNVSNPKEITNNVIELVGLKGKEASDPTDLSGGQLQRVQLARQLVSESDILFLDEPTNGLDVIISEQLLTHLKSLATKGVTCIVSSHDLDVLEKFCNKVLLIEEGKQVFYGSLDDFIASYNEENEFIIEIYNPIEEKVKSLLQNKYNILEWFPLVVSIENEKQISEILKVLIDHDIPIQSLRKDKKTLKEIILDDHRRKENNV